MKYCPRCKQFLNKSKFNKNKNRSDKLNGYCRICQNNCNKIYHKTKKGKLQMIKQNNSVAHKKASKKYAKKYSSDYNKIHQYEIKMRNKLKWIIKRYFKRNEFICAICGKQPIDTHHENYDLWFSFIPLCRKCHLFIGVNNHV